MILVCRQFKTVPWWKQIDFRNFLPSTGYDIGPGEMTTLKPPHYRRRSTTWLGLEWFVKDGDL